LTEFTNVTDRQTQTPHDGIGRACIASRDKNVPERVCRAGCTRSRTRWRGYITPWLSS